MSTIELIIENPVACPRCVAGEKELRYVTDWNAFATEDDTECFLEEWICENCGHSFWR